MRQLIYTVIVDKHRIEQSACRRLGDFAKSKQQKTTTEEGSGVEYSSTNIPTIDLSADSELSKTVENLHGSERYKIIQNYILSKLKGQPIVLSDGKKAVVDKSDALHLANKSGDQKNCTHIRN